MSPQMLCLLVVLVIVLVILLYIISVSNNIIKASIKVDEASSGIDVALAKRYDVLTKMIEVVKGYAKHEKETLFKVIELRKNMTIQEKNSANHEMSDQLNKINVLAESYPDLKASENFKTLQLAIIDVEEHLQAARRLYNANVSSYNQIVQVFPSNIIASAKGCVKKDFFEADEERKQDVKIEF